MCKRIKLKIANKLNLQIKVNKVYMSFEASFQTSTLSLFVMCQEHLHVHLTSYGCNIRIKLQYQTVLWLRKCNNCFTTIFRIPHRITRSILLNKDTWMKQSLEIIMGLNKDSFFSIKYDEMLLIYWERLNISCP